MSNQSYTQLKNGDKVKAGQDEFRVKTNGVFSDWKVCLNSPTIDDLLTQGGRYEYRRRVEAKETQQPKKISFKTKVSYMGEFTETTTTGYRLELDFLPNFVFVVHKDAIVFGGEISTCEHWVVSELTTGMKVVAPQDRTFKTRNDVIERAKFDLSATWKKKAFLEIMASGKFEAINPQNE